MKFRSRIRLLPAILAALMTLAPGAQWRPATAQAQAAEQNDAGASAEGEEADEAHPFEDPRLRPPPPEWEDPTALARVGDEVITAGDFHYALDHGKGLDRAAGPDSLKATVIDGLVNERLLVQEAYRRGYDRAGPLVGHVSQLADQIAGEELRRRIYAGQLEISDAELRELYDRYFYTLHVKHLSVERRDLAEELRGRILAGEDFADLARRYSEDKMTAMQGGDMGEVLAGRMIIHYEDVAFNLEPGELSEVLKGKGEHYKLFRVESKARDRSPSRSYEDMRPDLAKRVGARKAADALYTWQKSVMTKYDVQINEENFAVFTHRLRDKISSWEAINAVRTDSLPTSWIFLDWPPEETALDIVNFTGGGLTVAEFNKISRSMQTCPTCLWRDSDVQIRQFVLGHAFDKLYILEKKAIIQEHVPALDLELKRRKENRMAMMVGATLTVRAEDIPTADARAYWEEHKFEYMTGERARARRIVVGTEEEARDLVDRLEGGADFAALAERFSKDETTNWRGGETDLFGEGSMYGMADVALEHEPGELIPPFKSGLGWEIVQVIEKVPSEPRSFAEMEQSIKTHLAAEETRARVDAKIDEVRRATRVEIDERALSRLSLAS